LNRRRFLRYAGATVGVVGASALGLDYLQTRPVSRSPTQTSTIETTTVTTPTPPRIENLKWTPAEVVNGKVYEGTVSFEADDPSSPIVSAQLQFDPIYPAEIPMSAFSQEPSQLYSFTANANTATFSHTITNLAGGKQYKTAVTAKDLYGSEAQDSIDIPYVREFENITRNLKVHATAFYYPVYTLHGRDFQGDNTTPLLGHYDSKDPNVINKQIDWASGFGIGTFLPSYTAPTHPMTSIMENVYLESPIVSDMKFAFLYESGGRLKPVTTNGSTYLDVNDPSSIANIKTDFALFANNFFSNQNYLRIDGKPVVYFYLSRIFTGDIASFIKGLRDYIANLGFELFLVADEVFWYDNPNSSRVQNRIQLYDCITPAIMYPYGDYQLLNNFDSKVDSKFAEWSAVSRRLNIHFMPSALPGYDARSAPWNTDPNVVPLARTPERFKSELEICAKYLDPKLQTFLIYYNELNENTGIEPSKEEGFSYLTVLRDFLKSL
jgi:hypothetical protein